MAKMPGYQGQLLEVDLTAKTFKAVPLDPKIARDYLGGRALGVKLLWDAYGSGKNWAKVDPVGPDAVLCLMSGPTNGFVPGKMMSVFKSPLSGGAMGSAVSGDWQAAIRFAGYDGLVLKGKAAAPTYLYIEDDKVTFGDATKMWGMDVKQTHDALRAATHPLAHMVYIGPSGEKVVKFASVMTNWYRASGRGGSGAVMGSKNLKGVVVKGNKPAPDVADAATLKAVIDWAHNGVPLGDPGMHEYGTASGIYATGFSTSSEPVRNWQEEWHNEWGVRGEVFAADQWVRRYWADYGCTLACSKLGRVKAGARAGTFGELPDYEGGAYFGPNLGIYTADDILYLNDLVDNLGLDVISAGNTVAWACELIEKGVLTAADVGVDLKWGKADGFAQLIQMIAKRQGFGDVLAEGTLAAAKKIGKDSLKYAVQVKGIELGAHGNRSALDYVQDMLSYAISTQGGDHTSIASMTGEMWYLEDSMVVCGFWDGPLGPERLRQLINSTTGYNITQDELDKTLIPRWTNLQRATQLLAGWGAADDHAPAKFYDPLPSGPKKGQAIDKTAEAARVKEAYAARGWDAKGIPTAAALGALGMADVDAALASLR